MLWSPGPAAESGGSTISTFFSIRGPLVAATSQYSTCTGSSRYTAQSSDRRTVLCPAPQVAVVNSKYIDIAHYERKDLKPGYLIKGGCVISEEQTTTIVSKKFQTKVLSNGYLEITEIRGAK